MILCGMEQLSPFTDEQTEAQRSSVISLTPPILEEKLRDSGEDTLWATIYSVTGLWANTMPGTVTDVTSHFTDRLSFVSSWYNEWENIWPLQQLHNGIDKAIRPLLWVCFMSLPHRGPFMLFNFILFSQLVVSPPIFKRGNRDEEKCLAQGQVVDSEGTTRPHCVEGTDAAPAVVWDLGAEGVVGTNKTYVACHAPGTIRIALYKLTH